MDVTFFESQLYFPSAQTPLQGESPSEEKLMGSPLPIPAPTYELYEPPLPVAELRVYSRR
jgi:hypothetical protein